MSGPPLDRRPDGAGAHPAPGGVALSEAERREIAAEVAHYPDPRAASIEALKIVQRHRGWVSDEVLPAVAAALGMSAADLDGVATFYNMIYRRAVGRHVIHVCDSISCWVLGYDRLKQRLCEHLGVEMGQTTADGRFTLLTIPCLGACHRAPAMVIDGELYEEVDPEQIADILARYGTEG